jgi:hypothetical protein
LIVDENTKHLVASNLTIAYCANRPSTSGGGSATAFLESGSGFPHKPMKHEEVLAVYHHFLALLEPDKQPSA